MNWFYESAGEQQGPISDSELSRLLAEGKINENTLIWSQGMADWQPLKVARPITTPPLPSAVAGQGDVPPGFVRCTATGNVIPESEAVFIGGKPYSPDARPGTISPSAGLSAPQAMVPLDDAARTGPPWEQRAEIGLFRAVGETISGALLQPAATFARMRRTGGIGAPLAFYLLMGYICGTIASVYGSYFSKYTSSRFSSLAGPDGTPLFNQQSPVENFIYSELFLLFALPLLSFVFAGIQHLMLMLFGGARQGFETTYRVGCYAWGSVFVFWLLPGCGFMILVIWGLVASIIGLAAAHETSGGRTAGAVLAPFIVCCGSVALLYGAIIAAIVAAMQHAQ